ncbi:MAG: hypothetical protein U0992_10330 [Planctomycetaceae bacterium]
MQFARMSPDGIGHAAHGLSAQLDPEEARALALLGARQTPVARYEVTAAKGHW